RHIVHMRTRKKAPWTNGVIERWFRSVKYERLYRHHIGDGQALAGHVVDYRTIYNAIRPHEAIGMATPLSLYRKWPSPNFPDGESVSEP
ncbi:MAG: integrase core domain-containing protein, partial [Actinomycetota bacterium]